MKAGCIRKSKRTPTSRPGDTEQDTRRGQHNRAGAPLLRLGLYPTAPLALPGDIQIRRILYEALSELDLMFI